MKNEVCYLTMIHASEKKILIQNDNKLSSLDNFQTGLPHISYRI